MKKGICKNRKNDKVKKPKGQSMKKAKYILNENSVEEINEWLKTKLDKYDIGHNLGNSRRCTV